MAVLVLGGLALGLPLTSIASPAFALGVLMLVTAGLQVVYAYTARSALNGQSRFRGTSTSIITGILLIAASDLAFAALAVLLGISWIIDGAAKAREVLKPQPQSSRGALLFDAAVSVLLGLAIAIQWPFSGAWTVYVAVGLKILSSGWSMLLGRSRTEVAPASEPDPLREELIKQERIAAPVHLIWILTLLVTFFAIHVGRMQADWSLVGLISPFVAVLGDVFFALVICYVIVVPLRVGWGYASSPILSRLVSRTYDASQPFLRRMVSAVPRAIVRWQERFDVRLEQASRSPAAGLRFGLLVGLGPTAVFVAVAPLLGISWYFNTETWASGLWDHWAAQRTDTWRVEMVEAVSANAENSTPDSIFALHPFKPSPGEDFSFIVIGDPGEGDASQHILRDQYLALGAREDVKFLVISSDIIYPQGAMKDYEPKFYLPFKGFRKPIYAIPGNHDWYDALEAFSANVLHPQAARQALRARREADHKLTTTTEEKIEQMLAQAKGLREAYGIDTAHQRAPFFEIQTPHFALIAIDTGILRRIDDLQAAWFERALQRSRGKFVMLLSGHPFYAAGHYVAWDEEDPYRKLHEMARAHDVRLIMAGDTHDLEVYQERFERQGQSKEIHHIVNGGGGAYLSLGTALDWPKAPALADAGFYPRRDAIVAKLDREVPLWKRPLWWWTRTFGGWPSNTETLASAFASNQAPFYQSFCEVRVEPSSGVVRVRPYGANGRLRWSELQLYGNQAQLGQKQDEYVEWVIPMPAARE